MKKYIFLVIVSMTFISLNGQVLSNQPVSNTISGENAFFDASANFNTEVLGMNNNIGKGFVFPTVDLTTFEFKMDNVDGISMFTTFFNGMIVYNRATGTTRTDGNRSSTPTDVVPGFYYFFNPDGHINQNVTDGKWMPMGNSAVQITNGKDTLFIPNGNGGRDTIVLDGGGVTVPLSKDTLFIPNGNGGRDTIVLGNILPPGTKEGDVLTWNPTLNKWVVQTGGSTPKEFWLPSFNLPWVAGENQTVNLFDIYKRTFLAESAVMGTNYAASPAFELAYANRAVPGHKTEADATDFYYVATEIDSNIITDVSVNDSGLLTYKCTDELPTENAFINILMIRK